MPDSSRPPSAMQIAIISLVVGGAAGYGIRIWHENAVPDIARSKASGDNSAGGSPSGGGSRGGPAGAGGMAGAMGGGRGGPPAGMMAMFGGANGNQLAGLVRGLDAIEKAQGLALQPAQSSRLKPILLRIKKADKITSDQAGKNVDSLNAVLTDQQKQFLKDLQPSRRGGRMGGGGGMGGPPGGMGGPPGGMGGPPGGGAAADPEKPFTQERNSKALEDLLSRVH